MNKDRAIGSAKQASGAVKETIGNTLGDAKLSVDGKTERLEGRMQNAVGGAKDAVKK